MKAALAPFGYRFATVHGSVPAHFEAFHECLEEFEVDDVVLDNENVDGRNGTFEKTGWELYLRFRLSVGFETGRGSARRRSFLTSAV